MAKRLVLFKSNSFLDVLVHLGLVIALLTLIVMVLFSSILPSATNHGETVTVPDLTGRKVEELKRFLESRDLTFDVKDSTYSRRHRSRPGTVLLQSPEPGAKVKRFRKIYITVTPKNAPKVKMPKLIDVPFDMAERTLRNLDLDMGKITYKPFIGENVIMEQQYLGKKIQPNTYIPKGSKIDLVVGDGLGEKEFKMPDLVLMPLDEAEELLKGYDLLLGNITYVYNSKRELGTVIRQNPAVFIGKKKKGIKKGSPLDDRRRALVRAGELVDLWVVGNPAPKAKKAGKDDEKDPLEYLDTINIRKADEIKNYKDRKLKKDKKKEPKKTNGSSKKDTVK